MDSRLLLYYDSVIPLYIAVCEYGFGIDRCPAKAIRLAQEHVGVDDPVCQMLIYVADAVAWEDEESSYVPQGWKNGPVWSADITPPKLAGLTNTHEGWKRRLK